MGIHSPQQFQLVLPRILEDFAAQKTRALDEPLSAEPLFQPPSGPESEVLCLPWYIRSVPDRLKGCVYGHKIHYAHPRT